MLKKLSLSTGSLLLIIFLLTASSCSVSFEKRRYRPGYHVEVSHPVKNRIQQISSVDINKQQPEPLITNIDQNSLAVEKSKTPPIITENNKVLQPVIKSSIRTKPSLLRKREIKMDNCDMLILKDGVQMEVIVMEITETEIKYKKCNNPDGPTYIISSSKVEVIHLKNGDYYRPNPTTQYVDNSDDKMKTYLTATFVMALIAIFSTVLALVFASLGLYYLNFIGFIIGCFSLIESIIAFCLGFGGLKSKHIKATVSIIIGIIAFILSIVALVIAFL